MLFRSFGSVILWGLIIIFLSSIPGKDLPDFSFWKIFTFDKFAHTVVYAIFAFQVMKGCYRQFSSWYLRYYATRIAVITGIIFGLLVEIYQELCLTDRYGDGMDLLADAIGTVIGVVIFRLIFYPYIR